MALSAPYLFTETDRSSAASDINYPSLPLPPVAPCEAVRNLYSYGNLRFLHRDKSAISGRSIISRYDPTDGYRVVSSDEFWSDAIDNREAGRDYDFSQPFFPQFAALLRRVTQLPLSAISCEGSDWTNGSKFARNCYLCFSAIETENCLYCMSQYFGHDNLDCVGAQKSRYCYDCLDIDECYECSHLQDCNGCDDCIACYDCRSCSHCIGCRGLDRAEYAIFNVPLGKAEFERQRAELRLDSRLGRRALIERFEADLQTDAAPSRRNISTENCTGQYIRRSKNVVDSYYVDGGEDIGHCVIANRSRDCWKGFAFDSELNYWSGPVNCQVTGYSYTLWGGEHIWYSYHLFNSCKYCFGCAGLKGNSYCILNKQYSKQDYFDLVPRIVSHMKSTGEWGSYFPPKHSPHLYRESFADDYLETLPDAELSRRGYRTDPAQPQPKPQGAILASTLPDKMAASDAPELIGKVFIGAETGRAFTFQKKELEFYLRGGIPLPQEGWQTRLPRLIKKRGKMHDGIGLAV